MNRNRAAERAAADFARAAGYAGLYSPYAAAAVSWPNPAGVPNPLWGSTGLPPGLPAAAYSSPVQAAQALSLHQAQQKELHCQQQLQAAAHDISGKSLELHY